MSDVDDLLREFRADLPGPAEGARERILQRARSALALPAAAAALPPRRRRPARPLRWGALALGVAAAGTLVVAVAPTKNDAPTLLERAEAAIAPAHRIVELSAQLRSTTTAPGAINPNRTINMREWTLQGAGRAAQYRILISEGPLDKPPTDEDSTALADRTGRIVDQRSWTPIFVRARDNYDYPRGGGRGELEIGRPDGRVQGPLTLVDRLRDAYRNGQLKPSGRTAGGDLRFSLQFGGGDLCDRTELVLDAQTLLPSRMVQTTTPKSCRAGGRPTSSAVWTIRVAKTLPATAANRRLLEIGDWPTARTLQERAHGDPKPIQRVPPVPSLDEG